MKFYYNDVPGLGTVKVSRHAHERMGMEGITNAMFEKALLEPVKADIPDGHGVVWRQRDGVRIVILLKPRPNKGKGAVLVKTVFRPRAQAVART